VVGRSVAPATRSQKASAGRSTPSRNDCDPKVTRSGTRWIPSEVARSGGRSQAESATTATRRIATYTSGLGGVAVARAVATVRSSRKPIRWT
jgi:hypothetical protein